LTALDADDGRVLWQRNAAAPIGNALAATSDAARPLVLAPLLGGVATRGGLWCLEARSGIPLWKFPNSGKVFAAQLPAPAVEPSPTGRSASRVYCVDDGGAIFCLDLKTGDKTRYGWKAFARPLASAPPGTLAVLRAEPLFKEYSWGARLVVAGNDGGVRCFDARDGSLKWVFDAGAPVRCRPQTLRLGPANMHSSAPRDLILIGCDAPAIYALNAEDGSLAWKLRVNGPAFAGPVITEHGLLTITGDGILESFSLPE
jgi:outer membrane protein assembly factor BamB